MDISNDLPEFRPHGAGLARRLFTPLNIAAYITWAAISSAVLDFSALRAAQPREWAGAACLLGVMLLFVASALRTRPETLPRDIVNAMLQGVLVVAAEALLREGQTVVLLIIVAGQLVFMASARTTLLYLACANGAIAALWFARSGSVSTTLSFLLPVLGFQTFAAITGHYARTRELARTHLIQVNAELLATRRLLEESARAGERLKLSRELHDVAGHSLTALKLNLARMARDPALRDREELVLSMRLADELLAQIRQVVGALRAHDGLDLRAALEALGCAMPGVAIAVEVEPGLRVDDLDRAETLLRCAQEAITNALRHGRARHIHLQLRRDGAGLLLSVHNDGRTPERMREGHGLTGMRERLAAVGGRLSLEPTPPRGLRLIVRLDADADIGEIGDISEIREIGDIDQIGGRIVPHRESGA